MAQDEEDRKRRDQKKQEKIDEMKRELAFIEAGDDDSEEEKQMRKEAKRMISKYKGDVFQSVRDNNFEMTRAFLIVHGMKMLSLHNKEELGGGRTLVHAAAFFGCTKLLTYLIKLGANINCIDTSALLTTPLMEAARMGRTECIELLLENGANLKAQDASGDTAAHIAARAGRGGIVITMINAAEKFAVQSSQGFLDIRNGKKKLAIDVAKNERVQHILKVASEHEKNQRVQHKEATTRLKKGIIKAKVLGNQAGESALTKVKAKRKRYGDNFAAPKTDTNKK